MTAVASVMRSRMLQCVTFNVARKCISPKRTSCIANFRNISDKKVRQNYQIESEAGLNKQINLELHASYTYQSMVRQNYHIESEAGLNKQINLELHASYTYQSMAFYFERDDVALPGFAKFFHKSSEEEREHAEKMMTYQNKRGGRIVFQDVAKPTRDSWGSGLEAMQTALELEKSVNQSLLSLHKAVANMTDPQMADFIEGFLEEQVESIKQLGDYVTKLKRVGPGLGEYTFDEETLGD